MAADDELALPQIPEAKPHEHEDVSWALSTAEAMWARGDHLEGIKWVRKAAEAASEVQDDERALQLAKAASELATLVARRSRAFLGDAPGGDAAAEPPTAAPSGQPASALPMTTRSQSGSVPSPRVSSATAALSPPPAPPSTPRSGPPLASRGSQPPRAAPGGAVANRSPPRPPATTDVRQAPLVGRGILANRAADKFPKARRRSRENLEAEAVAAGVAETAPQQAVDGERASRALRGRAGDTDSATEAHPDERGHRRPRSDPEPTLVGRFEELQTNRAKSAAEWDASPTQNLTGDEMDSHVTPDGDRLTTAAFALPAPAAAAPAHRATQLSIHDPAIQTTQAVRVVVWRDASGVHVAPAGTVVSAIKIDAVLVVLEEGADLTAWLSERER